MPLDPTKDAANLDVTEIEMTDREKQNRFGQKFNSVPNVGNDGFLSIIAVTTPDKLTPEQWFAILTELQTNHGVTGLQALFEMNIPKPEEGCQNNLHTSAHLRQDEMPAASEEVIVNNE